MLPSALIHHVMTSTQPIRLKNPAHPGGFIKHEVIDPHGLSVTEAAKVLGVTRPALSFAGVDDS